VGHAHEELDTLQRDPYPTYARARQAKGLTFLPQLDAWLVARDADVREVLLRPEDFSSANAIRPDVPPTPEVLAELSKGLGGSPTVVTADGAAHQRYRAPLIRGLSSARIAAVVPFIHERAMGIVGAFAADGRVELMSRYAKQLPGEVIGRLLGLDPAEVPTAVHGSYRAEELLFRPLEAAEQVRAARDVVALQHLLDGHARRRRDRPGEDLCSEMVEGLAPGAAELTAEQRREVVSNLQNLLIAGHLTTTALIGTAVLHVLRNRPQWELLCARPELIPAAVEEAARYDTAVQGFRRLTTRPVTLAGADLPAGAEVFVAFGSANRDEASYDRPDVFDITRAPTRHLAFGHGAHACPGARLARDQVRITLEALTQRLPGLRLAPDQPVTMLPTLIHRSPRRLDLTWVG
jgi:cytochrome P450